MGEIGNPKIVVLISADAEWNVVCDLLPDAEVKKSPLGEWFFANLNSHPHPLLFFHGGWGKIAAAASTQYVIDRWNPNLLINLGTCGGFAGEIEKGEIILVERTVVYDIIEQMGDFDEHIAHYATEVDLSWLGDQYPHDVRRTLLVSGDRDLLVEDIPNLIANYGAVAGDWESGAIAWVTQRNNRKCLILRGVTDLVGSDGSLAYGDPDYFAHETKSIMKRLLAMVPDWLI